MIISRTPFRVSLFGGSTDYPAWYKEHGGAVLGFTIDKYCYLSVRYLPPYFTHKSRIVYSKEEWVNSNLDIQHPGVRGCLKYFGIEDGVEICHQSDLFARKGLGSSSAFVVGLVNSLKSLMYNWPDKNDLARTAIYIEQEIVKENVGCQDQYHCAYGGFNLIQFNPDDTVAITPIKNGYSLQNNLMLFDTGIARIASDVVKSQLEQMPQKTDTMKTMRNLVGYAVQELERGDIGNIGLQLNETWQLKKELSDKITNPTIDAIYETATKAGATGGKLLGAGGGGYILFFVPTGKHGDVRKALETLIHVPFKIDRSGSMIIFNDTNNDASTLSDWRYEQRYGK